MTIPRRPLWLLAGLAALLSPSARPLSAQIDLGLAEWTSFEWFAPGMVEQSFFLLATGRTRVRVTDAFISGDVFDLFVNGSLFAASSFVPGGVDTGAADGDAAWESTDLSHAEIFLDPGEYTLALSVRDTPEGFGFGEGFLRADPDAPAGVVPEPVSMVLLGTGLAGIGVIARRRRRPPPENLA